MKLRNLFCPKECAYICESQCWSSLSVKSSPSRKSTRKTARNSAHVWLIRKESTANSCLLFLVTQSTISIIRKRNLNDQTLSGPETGWIYEAGNFRLVNGFRKPRKRLCILVRIAVIIQTEDLPVSNSTYPSQFYTADCFQSSSVRILTLCFGTVLFSQLRPGPCNCYCSGA